MKRAIVVGLAIFGGVGLLAHLGLRLLLGSTFHDLRVAPMETHISEVDSPGGHTKAILFTDAGGGGLAPYCVTTVSVAPSYVENRLAYADDFNVSVMSCMGFKGATWLSDRELQIKIDPTLGAQGMDRMILKAYGDRSNIEVSYAF